MSKAERIRTQDARRKIAAQRTAARRARTRRRTLLAGGGIGMVIVLVVVMIVVSLTRPSAPPASAPSASAPAADEAAARAVTSVPAATFDLVGAGTATGLQAIADQPGLADHGKPELLYIGGEFCPYCAAERWAIAAAVSRFGTLTGIHFIHSAPSDGDTPTMSFYGISYASRYLSFVPVEWYGERPDPSTPFGHAYLQQPTPQQVALFSQLAGGSIPFVDIGNRYVVPQTQYLPSVLASLSWTEIAAAMHDPSSTVGKDIDGAANMITAAICNLTGAEPHDVCTSAGVKAASGSI